MIVGRALGERSPCSPMKGSLFTLWYWKWWDKTVLLRDWKVRAVARQFIFLWFWTPAFGKEKNLKYMHGTSPQFIASLKPSLCMHQNQLNLECFSWTVSPLAEGACSNNTSWKRQPACKEASLANHYSLNTSVHGGSGWFVLFCFDRGAFNHATPQLHPKMSLSCQSFWYPILLHIISWVLIPSDLQL